MPLYERLMFNRERRFAPLCRAKKSIWRNELQAHRWRTADHFYQEGIFQRRGIIGFVGGARRKSGITMLLEELVAAFAEAEAGHE